MSQATMNHQRIFRKRTGNPVHVAISSISQLSRAFEPLTVLYRQREILIEASKTKFQMYIYSFETFRRKFQILKWKDKKKKKF